MNNLIDISLPNFVKLNNDEFAQLLKDAIKLVNTATIEKLAVREELFTSIQTQLNLLTEASRQSRASQESENINKLDKQRSELVSFLISSFRLERKNPVNTRKEAALILFKEFKNYTGTQLLPTRQKSQAIDAMLKDFEKPENVKRINTLGLTQAVSSLKEINSRYQELVGIRAENQISSPTIKVREVRKEAQNSFKELIRFAYANHIINTSDESSTFIRMLNKLLSDTMLAYKQRVGQLAASKTVKDSEKEIPSSKD